VLASESPRREQLLRLLGVPFTVAPARIDERVQAGEHPAALVVRLAVGKAERMAAAQPGDAVVIGADTVVAVDDEVLGKPRDDGDARRMLGLLSGRSHQVVTGVAVVAAGRVATAVEETTVTFSVLDAADIDWYLATGDHAGKAGAYGIQGVAGLFVTRLEGSFTNVVGLPLSTVRPMLADAGFSL
jgi:septum formation protein